MDIPYYLGERLGVSAFVGGLIAYVILLLIVMLPVGMLVKNNIVLSGFLLSLTAVGIGVGWIPVYLFFILSFFLAVMFGDKIVKKF